MDRGSFATLQNSLERHDNECDKFVASRALKLLK